jgi:hypothetical protein
MDTTEKLKKIKELRLQVEGVGIMSRSFGKECL